MHISFKKDLKKSLFCGFFALLFCNPANLFIKISLILDHFSAKPYNILQLFLFFGRSQLLLSEKGQSLMQKLWHCMSALPFYTEKRTGTASFRQITDSFDHIMIINSHSPKMKMRNIGAKRPFSGGSLHLPALRPPSFRSRPPPPYRPHARCRGSQAPSEALYPTP